MSEIVIELIHPFNGTILQRWQFDPDCQPISIGRSKLSDIRLASKLVSRHHATLKKDARGWLLETFGANGCYVDGYFADGEYLRSNGLLSIGRAGPTLRFSICDRAAGGGDPSLDGESFERQAAVGGSDPGDLGGEAPSREKELIGSVAKQERASSPDEDIVTLEEIFIDRDTWYGDE